MQSRYQFLTQFLQSQEREPTPEYLHQFKSLRDILDGFDPAVKRITARLTDEEKRNLILDRNPAASECKDAKCIDALLESKDTMLMEYDFLPFPQVHPAMIDASFRAVPYAEMNQGISQLQARLSREGKTNEPMRLVSQQFDSCLKEVKDKQLSMPSFDANLCYSDDYISLDPWNEHDEASLKDAIVLFEFKAKKGYCYVREDLLQSMEATVVFHWTGKDEKSVCCPDRDIPYFKLPNPPYYVDWRGFRAVALDGVPSRYYLLRKIGQDRVGTSFSSSSLHGHLVDIYTLSPIWDANSRGIS
jgi:hypothetical protein